MIKLFFLCYFCIALFLSLALSSLSPSGLVNLVSTLYYFLDHVICQLSALTLYTLEFGFIISFYTQSFMYDFIFPIQLHRSGENR